MKDEKEKWVESVFESTKGSTRAKPAPDLFEKIEHQLSQVEAPVISMARLRMLAAAVFVLLIVNAFAMINYSQNAQLSSEKGASENVLSQQLLSDYNLYE